MVRAESVHVDWDEDGLHLLVTDDVGRVHDFLIAGCEAQLLGNAKLAIEPWLAERAQAYAEYRAGLRPE